MFSTLWHYLQGYVIVEISGFNVEKFLNLTAYHGLILWNIKRSGDKIIFSTSVKDFKAMRQDVRKTRSRLKIISKKGFPFIANRYKKRKWFVAGIAVFVVLLWVLSSCVWLIDVEGTSRINNLDVIHTLEANGYTAGKWKSRMNLREAETILLKAYPDIIWVGVDYEGTRMVVKVAESVLQPDMTALNSSTQSLISKRDALITYIAVEKGKPMVKVGDIVKKGDMLVSGEMPLGEEDPNPYYATAKATIKGKTIYSISKEISLQQVKKSYTNQTSKKYTFKFFNKSLNLYAQKPLEGNFDQLLTLHQLRITKLFPLPFGVEVQTRVGYHPTYKALTKEEAEDILLADLWQTISQSLDANATILKREAYFKASEGKVTGTLYVIAEEELGYPVQGNQEMQNKGEM